jgi:succinate dehydrogenase (ubiquinone) cytochrome b560 subunit
LLGWHLDTAALVSAFGVHRWSLPVAAKLAAKFAMAFPFTFHGVNGVGHSIWDTWRSLQRKQIVAQGCTILGLSFMSAVYLAVWMQPGYFKGQ